MSGVKVFIVVFLLLFGITLVVYPTLPPGEIFYDFLRIPEITFSILEISGETIIHSIINGVFYGLIVSTIYSLGRRASKREVIVVSVPTPTPVQMPTKLPVISQRAYSLPKVRKTSQTFVRTPPKRGKMDQDIEIIEGIGPTYGSRLRNSGVNVVEDLLIVGSTRNGRDDLAKRVNVAPSRIYSWVSRADLFRVRGIGTQYSGLLDSAGVNTVIDLSRRNSKSLYMKLKETNKELNLVRRAPTFKMVDGWIQGAKKLERIVEY